ncbi:MAG: LuxR C-terminal-related transcriptional regulator [Propionibacteriaceae bacterium]|jgi:DNA-binding NarL/FixJ family response regulator|nr:LuxR C-terminal-related transcriptional regulator [Propionibacteriaceae bacterium]
MPDPESPPRPRATERPPSVVVVDDDSQIRATFQLAFPSLDVVGAFPSIDALLATRPSADLLVLDLHLAVPVADSSILQGPRAVKNVADKGWRTILYTDERRLLVLAHCLAAGAVGIVRKSDPLADNERMFISAAEGKSVPLPRSFVGLAELLSRRGQLPELTQRQVEVLTARARGTSWQALAHRLDISPKTAYDHLEAVMAKLVWFLHDAGLPASASPADVERALGLAPGDLCDPGF